MTMKAIVNYDGMVLDEALLAVREVVKCGRVSESSTGKHYCWVTTFTDGTVVITREKKRNQSSDSFVVRKTVSDGMLT